MRLAFFIATLAALLFFTPNTFAQADNNQDNGSDPCFDAGASWEDCWTQAGYKGPRPYSCYARKSYNEACRTCAIQYNDYGQPTGYKVCAFVPRDANCTCKFGSQPADCATEGTCSYFSV